MTEVIVGGWWEDSGGNSLGMSAWNRLDQSLYRPVVPALFDSDDLLVEPFKTVRKCALALTLGDPETLRKTVLDLTLTDMRLLLGVKHRYTLPQLAALIHTSRSGLIDKAERLVTDLAHTLLFTGLEEVD